MAPRSDKRLQLTVDGNGFDGEMSADAAGIVVSLFALCEMANSTCEDELIERYHALRDFAASHAERSLIYRAID